MNTESKSKKPIKKSNFFYGWWVVIACFIISLFTAGVILMGFTVFFEPIAGTFSWSYAQVSLAATIQVILFAAMSPLAGSIADKWGARKLIITGIILVCAGLFLVSMSTSLWMFYLSFAMASIGFGACGGMALTTTVVHWFKRRVSLAIGVASSGLLTGGVLIPLITYLVDSYGWENALVFICIAFIVILLPMAFLIRNRPEEYGLLPDGDSAKSVGINEVKKVPEETAFKISSIFKQRTFWLITIGYIFFFLTINSATVHIMPYMTTIDVNRTISSLVASGMSVFTLLGSLSLGWLGDRIKRRYLAAIAFASLSISMLLLGFSASLPSAILVVFVILFAYGLGGGMVMLSALVNQYFDKRFFGTVAGFALGIAQVTASGGAVLTGWIFDVTGSYQGIWFLFTGIVLIGFIMMLCLPRKIRTD